MSIHPGSAFVEFPGRPARIPFVATAHKLARITYGMIKSGSVHDENEAFKVTPSSHVKRILKGQNKPAASAWNSMSGYSGGHTELARGVAK